MSHPSTEISRERIRSRSWVLASAGLVLVALVATGAVLGWREIEVRRWARSCRTALAAGHLANAQSSLDRWLRSRPESAEAHFFRARLFFEKGELGSVAQELEQARRLGHTAEEVDRLHALALARSGRYAEAEPILMQVIETSDRPDPEAADALARTFLESYKLKLAERVLIRWIRDAPRDARPYLYYTEIDRRSQAGPEAAILHFQAALERDPDLDKARIGLAEALLEVHRNPEAEREFSAYLARHPDDPAALVGAGLNALELSDFAAAARYLDRALEKSPKHLEALKGRATIELRRNNALGALDWFDRAAKVDPYDADVAYSRSRALQVLNRREEARAEQDRSNRLREDHARLLKIRDRINAEPRNNSLRCEVSRWMFEHGQPEQGIRWAETVLSNQSDHPEANQILADHYQKSGNAGLAAFYRLQAVGTADSSQRP
jgi:tetratricopeptide (TPR) repeat protein